MIHLKPAPGKRVRDPQSKKVLEEKGIKVDAIDTYWFRRIEDGDVVIVEPEKKAPAPAPKPQAKAEVKSEQKSKEQGV